VGAYIKRTWNFIVKYLVTGLESSSTKIVTKLIAYNLDLIDDVSNWDGHEFVCDEENLVVHKSIPHGPEDIFIDQSFIDNFDYVVLCTRDWNCSLLSKIENHQHNVIEANDQHLKGIEVIKNFVGKNNVFIFSSETAFLLQEHYTKNFLKSIGVLYTKHLYFENPNRKYIKDLGL